MGTCYLNKLGSGVALNFNLVGYTSVEKLKVATPATNTIGIVTEINITGWIFSPSEPSYPHNGRVWIKTGTASSCAFNALKKNGIYICPISAHQYIGDEWVERTAMSYSDGRWIKWTDDVTYLFKNGDQNDDITGGWSGVATGASAISIWWEGYVSSAGVGGSCSTQTNSMVDLTSYSVLTVTLDACDNKFYIRLLDSSGQIVASKAADKTSGVYTLDLSEISGAYYIQFHADGSYLGSAGETGSAHRGSAGFNVSEVKLIK